MPTNERFKVRPPETDTVYPESPKSPSVPESSNPPGRPSFQDEVDKLEDQNIQPGETGKMPGINLQGGREDEGPSRNPRGGTDLQGDAPSGNQGGR